MVGTPYSQVLNATGGGTVTWTLSSGALPEGLALSSAGTVSGTPTGAGRSDFVVQAEGGGQTASAALSITISEPLIIITSSLPDGMVGTPYSQILDATGGGGGHTWTRVSGTIPPGLALSPSGAIAGTPAVAGQFTFVVQVSTGSQNATASFTITVRAPVATVQVTPPAATIAPAAVISLTATLRDVANNVLLGVWSLGPQATRLLPTSLPQAWLRASTLGTPPSRRRAKDRVGPPKSPSSIR